MKVFSIVFVIFSMLLLQGCLGVPSQNTKYTIEVYASSGLSFTGSVGGGGNSRTIEGMGNGPDKPTIYEVIGWPAVAVIQKQTGQGTILVKIKDISGKVLNQQSTSAAYGIVSVSSG